jgi:WD40 repeat protein
MKGGIGIVEMLNNSNILALVGGGKNPKFPLNEFILWDEEKGEEIGKIKLKKEILNVKLKENKIYIVTEEKIFLFDFNLNLIDSFESKNPLGLISLCYKEDIIAYPDKKIHGYIRIKNYDKKMNYFFFVHKTPLSCIQLNQEGNLIATSSLKGTIVRLYNIINGVLIKEVRRGTDAAFINHIAFDPTQKFLAIVSDKKTVHLFFLNNANANLNEDNNNLRKSRIISEEEEKKNEIIEFDNKKSGFNGINKFIKFLGSEYCFTKYKINFNKAICSFGPDNTIIIVTYEGKYYQIAFEPVNNSESFKIQEEKF